MSHTLRLRNSFLDSKRDQILKNYEALDKNFFGIHETQFTVGKKNCKKVQLFGILIFVLRCLIFSFEFFLNVRG